MNFCEALKALINQGLIRRKSWADKKVHMRMINGYLCVFGVDTDGQYHPAWISDGDITANDWEATIPKEG